MQEYFEKYRRQAHVTPKSYLSFINGYKQLYAKKLADNRALATSINSGLQKMFEAKGDVNRMKVGRQGLALQSLGSPSQRFAIGRLGVGIYCKVAC